MRTSQLLDRAKRFIQGFSDPELQTALADIGLTDTARQTFEDLYQQAEEALYRKRQALSKQKTATGLCKEKRDDFRPILATFARCLKLIDPNSPHLSSLSMETHYTRIPEAGEENPEDQDAVTEAPPETLTKPRAVGRQHTLEKTHDRYRGIITNLPKLPENLLSNLAAYGWGPERIQQLTEMLETYLETCSEQEREVRNYHQAVADIKKLRKALMVAFRLHRNSILVWSQKHPLSQKLLRLVK